MTIFEVKRAFFALPLWSVPLWVVLGSYSSLVWCLFLFSGGAFSSLLFGRCCFLVWCCFWLDFSKFNNVTSSQMKIKLVSSEIMLFKKSGGCFSFPSKEWVLLPFVLLRSAASPPSPSFWWCWFPLPLLILFGLSSSGGAVLLSLFWIPYFCCLVLLDLILLLMVLLSVSPLCVVLLSPPLPLAPPSAWCYFPLLSWDDAPVRFFKGTTHDIKLNNETSPNSINLNHSTVK